MSKPRVLKAFGKLEPEIQEQIKLAYPRGFEKHLIRFKGIDGKFISALPYETEDRYYMVKMSMQEAQRIILNDEDYNDMGVLKDKARARYEEKFADDLDDDDDEDFDDDLDIDEIEVEETDDDDD